MSGHLTNPARECVPRWRLSTITSDLGELDSIASAAPIVEPHAGINVLVEAWKENGTRSFAADLVGSAFVLGIPEVSREAAEFLLTPAAGASSTVLALAQQSLSKSKAVTSNNLVDTDHRVAAIRNLRHRLNNEPNNPLMLVDLALHYTVFAQQVPARRAMRRALALAPDDRFVLRSAARLFLHFGSAEEAHRILRESARTQHDPWLMASEISIAALASKNPRSIKRARRIIPSVAPWHTSELAAAIGTLELNAGSTKAAKRLFAQGLQRPNENALAQIAWAGRTGVLSGMTTSVILPPLSFEAAAWFQLARGEWRASLESVTRWMADEPFGTRAARLGSFIAATVLEDYPTAAELAEAGLKARAEDPILLNNLAFSLASQNKPTAARAKLDRMTLLSLNTEETILRLATSGLIDFRLGNLAAGREQYRDAVSLARGSRYQEHRIWARLFYAREECALDRPTALTLLDEASHELSSLHGPTALAAREVHARVAKIAILKSGEIPSARKEQ